jgi:hypothetical protein
MDSDAEIENHERQLEQTLLQDYFFVNRDSICLYLLFKEILKIIFLIIKVI